MASLLNALSQGVMALGEGGRVLLANEALSPVLNRPPSETIGLRLWEVLRQRDVADLADRGLAGRAEEREILFQTSPERLYRVRSHPFQHQRGPGLWLTFDDLTHARRLENIRKEFVANVSHELKTPLTALRAALETLIDGAVDDPDAAKDFLSTAQDQVDRLQRLIDDLLTLSRLEKPGAAAPSGARAEVAAIGRRVAKALEPLARKNRVSLSVDGVPPDLRAPLTEDELTQILMNLVDNAIKFNRDNGRTILTATARDGEVVIEVKDTGVGIAREDQDRLFERFYRVDKARTRETGGTGLGLSIVKHLVENRGGRVSVEST
ncbi:MAG TPA: ATP-binding protein, partial [Elusimicrobiota bacterium]|nr:ATP-binding protein [Elusimicrobiota bacterium]